MTIKLMEKNDFKKKFQIIKKYQDEIPGIKLGLAFLRELNGKKLLSFKKSKSDFEKVNYYDVDDDIILEYSFEELNLILQNIYIDYANNKILLNTKLYWIFSNFLEKIIVNNKYKFRENFTIHDILTKFIHGLRKNRNDDITVYFLRPVITDFYIQYLDVSGETFFYMMRQFILDLWNANVLSYDRSEDSIAFNPIYYEDLCNLVFFSFDLMLLGRNSYFNTFDLCEENTESSVDILYKGYKTTTEQNKIAINDFFVSFTISCSVEIVSADRDINNIFIEKLKNNNIRLATV